MYGAMLMKAVGGFAEVPGTPPLPSHGFQTVTRSTLSKSESFVAMLHILCRIMDAKWIESVVSSPYFSPNSTDLVMVPISADSTVTP